MAEQKERILIVDDTPENLDVLSGLLEDYEVMAAINGHIALELARGEDRPDIILLDIMMPEIDGYQVAEELKADEKTKDIPIIFITAKTDTESVVKGFEKGASDYITKPFEPKEVLARVQTHLELVAQRKQLDSINDMLKDQVTARTKDLEKALTDLILAKEKAEASDKLKGEFLAQMSHEIRTPLNAVISLSGIVLDEVEDGFDPELKDMLERIQDGGKRIIRTVELIVNYSELSAGTFEFKKENYNPVELAENVVEEYKDFAAQKSLNFVLEKEIESSIIEGDPYSVKEIMANIIDNAIKYTESGDVKVRVGRSSKHRFQFECVDTGIGIGETYFDRMYLPFTQEDEGYTRKYEGNGLGLALVKKYCDLNKIQINVESQKGKGSKFELTF